MPNARRLSDTPRVKEMVANRRPGASQLPSPGRTCEGDKSPGANPARSKSQSTVGIVLIMVGLGGVLLLLYTTLTLAPHGNDLPAIWNALQPDFVNLPGDKLTRIALARAELQQPLPLGLSPASCNVSASYS